MQRLKKILNEFIKQEYSRNTVSAWLPKEVGADDLAGHSFRERLFSSWALLIPLLEYKRRELLPPISSKKNLQIFNSLRSPTGSTPPFSPHSSSLSPNPHFSFLLLCPFLILLQPDWPDPPTLPKLRHTLPQTCVQLFALPGPFHSAWTVHCSTRHRHSHFLHISNTKFYNLHSKHSSSHISLTFLQLFSQYLLSPNMYIFVYTYTLTYIHLATHTHTLIVVNFLSFLREYKLPTGWNLYFLHWCISNPWSNSRYKTDAGKYLLNWIKTSKSFQ